MKSAVALTLSLSLVACYGAAPPKPPVVPLPPIASGAEIDVHSESKTTIENSTKRVWTCPAGESDGGPNCTHTDIPISEPVTRVTTTASYGSEPITYAQFKVLTDPRWDEKLVQLEDLSHKCQRANTPRYVGISLMLGGLLAGLIVGGATGNASAEQGVIYGGLGAGAVAYGFGYFGFGGRQCVEARQLFDEMDMSQAMNWNTVEGADYETEMKTLAAQFNAAHGGRTTALRMRH